MKNATMLYQYPSVIKSNSKTKGFIDIRGVGRFDYIVVDESEVEACLKEGFFKTTAEAFENNNKNSLELNDLKELSFDDIKSKYTVEELRDLAKKEGIKSYSNMLEDNLVKKLMEKIGD